MDEKFPRAEIEAAGYRAVYAGQKTYNGVAILSRAPAQDIVTDIHGMDDPQRRVLAATFDGVRVLNLYVPNGESLESDKYRYKLNWLAKLTDWMRAELSHHSRLVVLGKEEFMVSEPFDRREDSLIARRREAQTS